MINESLSYIPKGGMCATCVNRHSDCSHLPFNDYPPLHKGDTDGVVVVKCLAFNSETKNKESKND